MNQPRRSFSPNVVRCIALLLAISGLAIAQPDAPTSKPADPPPGAPDPMEHREPKGQRPPRPDSRPDSREMRPPPEDRLPETFDREAFKKRLENRIKEYTATQERLQKALEKLESGAPLTDVWAEIGPPGSERFTGRGPSSRPGNLGDRLNDRMGDRNPERNGDRNNDRNNDRPRRPDMELADSFTIPQASGERLNPEEREKLFRYLDENMPVVAQRFRDWEKNDHEAYEIFLDRIASRVREAGSVIKRDPVGAKLRMNEVEKGLDVLDAAKKLNILYAAGNADDAALTPARAQLKDALSGQMDARFAVHQHQITTLERQIGDLRKQADDMSAKKEDRLSERCGAFDASIRDRATKAPGDPKMEGKPEAKSEGRRNHKPGPDNKPDPDRKPDSDPKPDPAAPK